MPALGGRPERISPFGSAEGIFGPQWSANGSELAHMRREAEGNVIEIVSLATRQTRRIAVPGDQGNRFDLTWSPDGRYFAYVRAASRGQEFNRLWVLRAADGKALPSPTGRRGSGARCGPQTACTCSSSRTGAAALTCGTSGSRAGLARR